MIWKISLAREAEKFLEKNRLSQEEIFDLIRKTIKKFQGENINIDIKKLKGPWLGFYRIRKGNFRIVAEFNFENFSVLVEQIDQRGKMYR